MQSTNKLFNIVKAALTIVITLLLIISDASAQGDVTINKEYLSPDGKYSFSLQETKEDRFVQIRNIKNNCIAARFDQECVPDSIEWNKSSSDIFIINSMSGAADLAIISLRNGKWGTQEYYPSHSNPGKGEFAKCYLYDYTVHKNIIKAYFAYTFENNWTKDGNMDVSGMDIMEINLTNGKIQKATNKKISYDKYYNLIH